MAKRVWAHMKESDSKECRNCHKFEKMDTTKQKDRSVVKHEGAREDGKTCIDCHKGIAHKPVHHLSRKGWRPRMLRAARLRRRRKCRRPLPNSLWLNPAPVASAPPAVAGPAPGQLQSRTSTAPPIE
jgi:hypothetical protein